jgi:hypothetical protein
MNDLEQEDIEQYGCSIPEGFDGERAIEVLQNLPPVTPKQRVGQWIFDDKCKEHGHCSLCGYGSVDLMDGEPHDFCRQCGAKMAESEVSE